MPDIKRLNNAMSPAAMLIAIVALVVASAGVGYAAAKIGTRDIKNNAVTSAKVRNGTLKAADMVRERRTTYVGNSGAPAFQAGGEGDCVWQLGSSLVPGLGRPGFRKDRFGTVHLVGIAVPGDGAGGDGDCDSGAAGETEDAIAFILPAAYRPARTQLLPLGSSGGMLIVGPGGLAAPGITLPAGAVAVLSASTPLILDGVSYQPAGSRVVSTRDSGRLTPEGRRLLAELGVG